MERTEREEKEESPTAYMIDLPSPPWEQLAMQLLEKLCIQAYSKTIRAKTLAQSAGINLQDWHEDSAPGQAWHVLLEIAMAQGLLRDLLTKVLADTAVKAFHTQFRRFLTLPVGVAYQNGSSPSLPQIESTPASTFALSTDPIQSATPMPSGDMAATPPLVSAEARKSESARRPGGIKESAPSSQIIAPQAPKSIPSTPGRKWSTRIMIAVLVMGGGVLGLHELWFGWIAPSEISIPSLTIGNAQGVELGTLTFKSTSIEIARSALPVGGTFLCPKIDTELLRGGELRWSWFKGFDGKEEEFTGPRSGCAETQVLWTSGVTHLTLKIFVRSPTWIVPSNRRWHRSIMGSSRSIQ